MKPDIEINGRYFVEGEVINDLNNEEKILTHPRGDIFINYEAKINQSLPLGKCWVELEKFINEWGKPKACFKIKLDQSGKAIVLTELPEDEKFKVNYNEIKQEDILEYKEHQSPDELAEEILSKHTGERGVYLRKGKIRGNDALDAMQEYHRMMSEGMFTKEDIIALMKWLKHLDNGTTHYNPYTKEESESIGFSPNECFTDDIKSVEWLFEKWLESRKEKK